MKRTVKQRVDEFKLAKKENEAKLTFEEFGQIQELSNDFEIITTAFYFGYMKGWKKGKKGGAKA